MVSSSTLDNIIGVVTVILALSFVVQAVQSGIKKLLKLKSRQIEESLVDLFETALAGQDFSRQLTGLQSSKGIAAATLPDHGFKDGDKKRLFGAVEDAYNGTFVIGVRDANVFTYKVPSKPALPPATGKIMVASHSEVLNRFRSPLLQLLPLSVREHPSTQASPEVNALFNAVTTQFEQVGRVSTAARRMLDSISKDDLIKVLNRVAPGVLLPRALEDLQGVLNGVDTVSKALKGIDTKVLSGQSAAQFEQVRRALMPLINDAARLLDEKGTLRPGCVIGDVLALRGLELDRVLKSIGEIDSAVVMARAEAKARKDGGAEAALIKLDEGLKELVAGASELQNRYDMATAPLRRRLQDVESWFDTVMHSFEERYDRSMKTYGFVISLAVAVWLNASAFTVYRQIATNDSVRQAVEQIAAPLQAQYRAELEQAAKNPSDPRIQDQLKGTQAQVKAAASVYQTLGFPTLEQEFHGKTLPGGLLKVLELLCGWSLMAVLLNAGAPFWHDVLEALFGIKTVLRKRGEIQNVEQRAGSGQPKA